MSVTTLILATFATWRLGNLIAHEDGPFEMFDWLRTEFGVKRDESSGLMYGENPLARLIMCTMCNTIWIAMATSFLLEPTSIFEWFIYTMGISGLAIVIEDKR